MRTYRDLFGVPEFRVLFVTQCLTMAAAATAGLALGTIVHEETGSAVLTGLSMFGGPLVALLASAFLLSASDIIRPRRALVLVAAAIAVADLVQAVPGDAVAGAVRAARGGLAGAVDIGRRRRRLHGGPAAAGGVRARPGDPQHRRGVDADRGLRDRRRPPHRAQAREPVPGRGRVCRAGGRAAAAGAGGPGGPRERTRRPAYPRGQPAAPRLPGAPTALPELVGAERPDRGL